LGCDTVQTRCLRPERLHRLGRLGPQQPVVHAVVGVRLGDQLGRGDRVERPRRRALLVPVEAEERGEVGLHRLQQLQPVGLGRDQRLLVRDDDALAELVQPDRRHEPAPPYLAAVGGPEALLERIERGDRIAPQDPLLKPARPVLRRARVLVRERSVPGAILADREMAHVVGAAPQELVPLLGRDLIVRRSEELSESAAARGGVTDGAKWKELGHGAPDRRTVPRAVQGVGGEPDGGASGRRKGRT